MVMPAVIMAPEANDFRFACKSPGEPDRQQCCFGSRSGEPNLVGHGQHARDATCPCRLPGMTGRELAAFVQGGGGGCQHIRMTVPQHQRSVAAEKIQVLIVIHIKLSGSLRTVKDWAVGLEKPGIRGHTTGQNLSSLDIDPRRLRGPGNISVDNG